MSKPLKSIKFPGMDESYTVPVVDSDTIRYINKDGEYLNKSGNISTDSRVYSKITEFINVFEGDIFSYKGRGDANSASAIWYDKNNSILRVDQIYSTNEYKELIPPKNSILVIFSSYCNIKGETILDVIRSKNNILGIESEINNIKNNIKNNINNMNSIYFDRDKIHINYLDSSYINKLGKISHNKTTHCKYTDYIKIYPNDNFYITEEQIIKQHPQYGMMKILII